MNKLSLIVCGIAMLIVLGCGESSTNRNTATSANNSKPDAASTKTSQDYLEEGNAAFKEEDYKKAIEPYRKAFEMEKKDQKLEKKWWFILIDNLSIAYGITGDVKNSREVLEYGISKEPKYPLFYYNLADGYGEENDEANALKNLELAYKYKANILDGEHIPEPTTDSSFRVLMKSPTFKKAVMEMKEKN